MAFLGDAAAPVVPALVAQLSASNATTRAGAAFALGTLGHCPDLVVPQLCELLDEKNPTVLGAAAEALHSFGRAAEPAGPRLVTALIDALRDCDHSMIDLLGATLVATSSDPCRVVRDSLQDGEEELRNRAIQAVEEAIESNSAAD